MKLGECDCLEYNYRCVITSKEHMQFRCCRKELREDDGGPLCKKLRYRREYRKQQGY